MSLSILKTKLYFPALRPSLVPRLRLVERLQAGLEGPFVLVSAPAGSGKTTLVGEWRAGPGAGRISAWVALDAADNDPLRFFQYVTAALEPARPGLMEELQPLLAGPELPPGEAFLTELINSLSSARQDFVLTLDDYHLIENPVIHQALAFLLDHLPLQMHVIVLTRVDPPLPLARLRARGQMTEIRAADLRFSVDEAAAFMNQVMGLALTRAQVTALEQRTEGWAAGLQLAGLSMQGHADLDGFIAAFTGSHRYIVDYLAVEVLGRQSEETQAFLLKTCILERLCGPLCNALTGREDGQAVLEGLGQAGLSRQVLQIALTIATGAALVLVSRPDLGKKDENDAYLL